MNHNWKIKLVVFFLLFLGFLLLGNIIMAWGLKVYDINLDDLGNSESLTSGQVIILKWLSTLNHIIIFTASSLIWIFIYYRKSFFKYRLLDALLIVYFLCWLLFSFPLIAYTAQLNMMVELPEWASSVDNNAMEFLIQMLNMEGIGDLIINIIIIAIVPAIGEELLFRGVILKELLMTKINPHLVVILVAVIFSLFHFQLSSFFPKLVIGLILSYSYFWTRNLMYPIIIHFFNNALQVTLLYTASDQIKNAVPEDTPPVPVFSIILSAILCAIIVDAIIKRTKTLDEGA